MPSLHSARSSSGSPQVPGGPFLSAVTGRPEHGVANADWPPFGIDGLALEGGGHHDLPLAGFEGATISSAVNNRSGRFGRRIVVSRSEGWWPTTNSVPPGRTAAASLRCRDSRSAGGRCMNCADTRSNCC